MSKVKAAQEASHASCHRQNPIDYFNSNRIANLIHMNPAQQSQHYPHHRTEYPRIRCNPVSLSSLFWTSEPRSDLSLSSIVVAVAVAVTLAVQCSAVQASLDPPLQGASRKHPPVISHWTACTGPSRRHVPLPFLL